MKIIVGLGNPGNTYERTRHNVGYLAVDYLAEHFSCSSWSLKKQQQAWISDGVIDGEKVVFVKPDVFMNVSGGPVSKVLNWYKEDVAHLVVVHDDTDVAVGAYKVQSDRGAAGHNGISSIIHAVGSKEFSRIRIGVRPEGNTLPAVDLVLGSMSSEELSALHDVFISLVPEIKKICTS